MKKKEQLQVGRLYKLAEWNAGRFGYSNKKFVGENIYLSSAFEFNSWWSDSKRNTTRLFTRTKTQNLIVEVMDTNSNLVLLDFCVSSEDRIEGIPSQTFALKVMFAGENPGIYFFFAKKHDLIEVKNNETSKH